jgi:probable phosphoglycerate mutase
MRNQYFALRHGISVANEERIIISHPDSGVTGWGLSDRGAAECRRLLTPARLQALGLTREDCIVYSSDFLRAAETAAIFCQLNGFGAPILDVRLRERDFGRLERRTIDAYDLVWARDLEDDDHGFEGCEGTAKLAARLRSLLGDLESCWNEKQIVLVSHGDPLQVLQTILLGLPCNRHRALPHLGNAELRRIDAQ